MDSTRKITHIAIIGAGGVTSYLLPALIKTFQGTAIRLWDGDTLEERNLDRQLFREEFIGTNKAQALLSTIGIEGQHETKPSFFTSTSELDESTEVIIVCADNHPARKTALYKADELGIPCLIGANEYIDSEAYIYYPQWRGSHRDPRIRYPEILTDTSGDPLGCQGEQQEIHPQLAVANFAAAAKVLQLLWAWTMTEESSDHLPFEITSNVYQTQSQRNV